MLLKLNACLHGHKHVRTHVRIWFLFCASVVFCCNTVRVSVRAYNLDCSLANKHPGMDCLTTSTPCAFTIHSGLITCGPNCILLLYNNWNTTQISQGPTNGNLNLFLKLTIVEESDQSRFSINYFSFGPDQKLMSTTTTICLIKTVLKCNAIQYCTVR